jgi:hypothetical protein
MRQENIGDSARGHQGNVWLFQANPGIYDLVEALKNIQVGDTDDWLATRYQSQIKKGDIVLFWQSGAKAGLYAIGEITRELFQRPRSAYNKSPGLGETEPAVAFRYTQILESPVLRDVWVNDPVLQNSLIIRQPTGSNFPVTADEWLVVQQMIEGNARRERRVVKIAPGDNARLWEDCLRDGYICVGWDDIGDLMAFSSKEDLLHVFGKRFRKRFNGSQSTVSRTVNELWTLRELRPGDLVVANKGKFEVLAVGTVQEPGYQWHSERTEYNHTVKVVWDTSWAKAIPEQTTWGNTVVDVSPELQRIIFDRSRPEPTFEGITSSIAEQGLRIDDRTLRCYHIGLQTRGFVILCGISGTGKTWLTEAYAKAVRAEYCLVPVAPNWTTNEDLLGYFNPLNDQYYDTPFSHFLRAAAAEYQRAIGENRDPAPYHLVLDEMNLARVEYYFAKFLSAMEVRARIPDGATIELKPGERVLLPPNLRFIGTVNMDETTHGFADKVFDRAQLIELPITRSAMEVHLTDVPYREDILEVWDAVAPIAPFAFRVADEICDYVDKAQGVGATVEEALDEQFLHKVLPKVKGADPKIDRALDRLVELTTDRFPLTYEKAEAMRRTFVEHGFADFFAA